MVVPLLGPKNGYPICMTGPDRDSIPPDPPWSPGTPKPPHLDVDVERFKETREVPEAQGANPDAASPEPPD